MKQSSPVIRWHSVTCGMFCARSDIFCSWQGYFGCKCHAMTDAAPTTGFQQSQSFAAVTERVPPHAYFLVSAVFHYLGPAFAVLLFAHVAPLGVAWLRIASAAAVFALWR